MKTFSDLISEYINFDGHDKLDKDKIEYIDEGQVETIGRY